MTESNIEHANWEDLSVMKICNTAVEPGQREFVLRNSGDGDGRLGKSPCISSASIPGVSIGI